MNAGITSLTSCVNNYPDNNDIFGSRLVVVVERMWGQRLRSMGLPNCCSKPCRIHRVRRVRRVHVLALKLPGAVSTSL